MLTALTYDDLCERLSQAFKYRYKGDLRTAVRMVGLLFARPASPLAKAEIVPALDDYYIRSGNHIDFFLSGYALLSEPEPNFVQVLGSRGDFWQYSSIAFDIFRRDIESRTKWKYSGGCDLILCNATYNTATERAELDFHKTIVCQLDKMKAEKCFDSLEMFFEKIFRFAEEFDGSDPTWGFSDSQGAELSGSALKRLILSLLPSELGGDIKRLQQVVVSDVGA